MASSCEGARCRCSGLWCDPFQPSALTGASELGDVVWANMHELLAPLVIAPFGAVAEAESVLGMVDIVVNNAGIPDAQRAHKMPIDLVD